MIEQQTTLQAYSYRVSARFGSRVWVSVGDDTVSVTGPRLPRVSYRLWITIQAVLLALVVPALAAAIVFWGWRFLLVAVLLLAAHGAAGGFGAGCLWELMDLIVFGEGRVGATASFPLRDVKRVKVGHGWARRGKWLLILPYVAVVNSMVEGYCVSFEAPDGETGQDVVYTLHMRSTEDAQKLAAFLEGRGFSVPSAQP